MPLPAVEQGHGAAVRGDAVDLNLMAADHEVGVDFGVVEELALRRVLRQVIDRPAETGAVGDMRDRVLVEERVEEDQPGGLDLGGVVDQGDLTEAVRVLVRVELGAYDLGAPARR